MSFGMTASAANDPEDYTKDSLVIGSLDTYVGNGWCQNGPVGIPHRSADRFLDR